MFDNNMGVFEKIEDAVDAAKAAQKALMANNTTQDRQKMIENIKKRALERLEEICMMEYTETGYSMNTNFNTQITINPQNLTVEELDEFDGIR